MKRKSSLSRLELPAVTLTILVFQMLIFTSLPVTIEADPMYRILYGNRMGPIGLKRDIQNVWVVIKIPKTLAGKNACLGFGHSCLGGFGKRTFRVGSNGKYNPTSYEDLEKVAVPANGVNLQDYLTQDVEIDAGDKISDKNKLIKFFMERMTDNDLDKSEDGLMNEGAGVYNRRNLNNRAARWYKRR